MKRGGREGIMEGYKETCKEGRRRHGGSEEETWKK